VSPSGVDEVTPAGAVVSFLAPEGTWDNSVIQSFCHFVLYFASRESGEAWTREHPGTFLLSVDEALEIGRRVNSRQFPSVVHAAT
jgi:alkylmercury lyase